MEDSLRLRGGRFSRINLQNGGFRVVAQVREHEYLRDSVFLEFQGSALEVAGRSSLDLDPEKLLQAADSFDAWVDPGVSPAGVPIVGARRLRVFISDEALRELLLQEEETRERARRPKR